MGSYRGRKPRGGASPCRRTAEASTLIKGQHQLSSWGPRARATHALSPSSARSAIFRREIRDHTSACQQGRPSRNERASKVAHHGMRMSEPANLASEVHLPKAGGIAARARAATGAPYLANLNPEQRLAVVT